ncbi:MAG: hypothetical protein AABX33_02070 [Nanoarchaeota archaeon]
MVKQINETQAMYYICEECNFAYNEKEITKKCENWCRKHHSCNIEITKHAIES